MASRHLDVAAATSGDAAARRWVGHPYRKLRGLRDEHPEAREVLVLRKGSTSAERLVVAPPPATAAKTTEAYATIRVQRVPYHHGHVAILSLLDVPDDLGVEMASALAEARLEPGLPRGARARAR